MSTVLRHRMRKITGEEVDLADYLGHVVLIVNVASECGLTPQYEGLQKLHEKYHDQGLRILAFPANEFGNQEPGSDADIKAFCQSGYGVEFEMFSKIVSKGPSQCPLYQDLTSGEYGGQAGDLSWNFEKFLLNRQGELVNRFEPKVEPLSDEVVQAIEAELEKK